jgi:hypothetical protein
MRKCAKILSFMRSPLVIYDFASALSSKFPYIWRKFCFLFYQCSLFQFTISTVIKVRRNATRRKEGKRKNDREKRK